MLIDAKASHNEVHAFGSESRGLFQSALHAVFLSVFLFVGFCFLFLFFFNNVFPMTLMCVGLPNMGMLAYAHSAVPDPSPSAQTPLHSASWITVSSLFKMATGE